MNDNKRLTGCIRGVSPCTGCKERFTACWDRCPIDARGEYGYLAWRAEIKRVNEEREKYKRLESGKHYSY